MNTPSKTYRARCQSYWKTHPLPYDEHAIQICTNCKRPLPLTPSNFYPNRTTKRGIRKTCIPCFTAKVEARRHYRAGLEKITPLEKKCRRCGETKPASCYFKNAEYSSGLDPDCKACRSARAARHYIAHRKAIRKNYADWRANLTPDELERIRARDRKIVLNYIHGNPAVKVKMNITRGINYMLRQAKLHGRPGNSYTEYFLGCSKEQLVAHLESQFKPGMSWDNYGRAGWHIHHYIPVKARTPDGVPLFNVAESITDLGRCFHYLNLRPEWAAENLSISNTLPADWEAVLASIDAARAISHPRARQS